MNGIKQKVSGWNLQESIKPFSKLTDEDVIKIVNSALLSNPKRTTSYKFAFFKSILDNLFNVDLNSTPECFLSFDSISMRFTEIYWNLVLKFGLSQMPQNQYEKKTIVETKLFDFCKKYGFNFPDISFPFESLKPSLQLEIAKTIQKTVVEKNVLGAFCSDTNFEFYHFSKAQKWNGIYLNHDAFVTLAKYKSDFEKINYFEWIKYLESVNTEEQSYQLAKKLDASTERQNLNQYRNALFTFGQTTCFYCGKPLSENAVDHFIPWSFTKDDKVWNFVLSCPSCNSRKSNRLTTQHFLQSINLRNQKLCNVDLPVVKEDFKTYTYSKLALMYSNAIFNGFTPDWQP